MKTALFLAICCIVMIPALSLSADYVIGEGDGLDIAVWGNKDLNVGVKVRPDGKITMPGLGDVAASGMTPRQLQGVLAEKLKNLVKNPFVTVSVREITNSKVYVFGGGIQSRVYDLNRRTTLLQLLCMIGNVSAGDGNGGGSAVGGPQVADYRKACIIRNGKKIKEDFYKLFITGDTSDDIIIESNDSIFIPQQANRTVYVLGAVTAPKAIAYREGMTVLESILESGGFTKFAKQNDVTIVRKEEGKKVSIPIRAKDITHDSDLSQNMNLKPGDYVIVSEGIF